MTGTTFTAGVLLVGSTNPASPFYVGTAGPNQPMPPFFYEASANAQSYSSYTVP